MGPIRKWAIICKGGIKDMFNLCLDKYQYDAILCPYKYQYAAVLCLDKYQYHDIVWSVV